MTRMLPEATPDPAHPGKWSVEASTLGYGPGVWPDTIFVRCSGIVARASRGEQFRHGEELGGFRYHDRLMNYEITVWND